MRQVGRAREQKRRARGAGRLLGLPVVRSVAGTWRQGRHGQAMVEFAIVLPVLMLILLVAVDFGRVFATYIEINNTAREAANYAAIHYADGTYSSSTYYTVAGGEPNIQGQGGEGALMVDPPVCSKPDGTAIDCTGAAAGGGAGNLVSVRVHREFTFLTPFIGGFFSGGALDMSASVSAPVLNPLVAQMLPSPSNTNSAPPTASPTATSSASASITASPTVPGSCKVPDYWHTYWDNSGGVTDSTKIWTMAGFTGTLTNKAGTFKIQNQSIAAGSDVSCSSDMSVDN